MRTFYSIAFAAAMLLAAGSPAPANANLIANGDFTLGLLDWSTGATSPWSADLPSPFGHPHSPPSDATDICNVGNCLSNLNKGLSQTVTDISGGQYGLSFFWAPGNGNTPNSTNELVVDWGPLGSQTKIFDDVLKKSFTYTQFSMDVIGSGSDTLTFFALTSAGTGQTYVDDVALVAVAPEPGSLSLLGAALFGFGLIRRRRNQQARHR